MALTDNLIAYYKLDESSGDAIDSVGSHTLTNTNSVSYSTGLINNGADFGTSNTNKKLSTSTSLGITTGDFTVSWWFKNDGTDREFDGQVSIGTGTYSMIFFRNGTNNRWFLATSGGGNTLITESITNSTWYFLTMVKSGGTVTVYVNGTSKGSTSTLGSSATVHFTVGGFPDFGWYGTNKIDEISVWNRALSGAEITSLYNSGTGTQYPFGEATVNTLVVGGGGAGGTGNNPNSAGGGGAGGYQANSSFAVTQQHYSVVVGAGGIASTGTSGGSSSFGAITANGGGYGGDKSVIGTVNGQNGGSGGGGAVPNGTGGTGSQGNNGGTGAATNAGAGGGGASAAGGSGSGTTGGNGGDGAANSISGSSVTYAGGGGGGGATPGSGGAGGGGAGSVINTTATAGTANTGGGGGGQGGKTISVFGGNGGSGVVIIAYKTDGSDGVSAVSKGGTITTSGANTIHTFTSSGTWAMVDTGHEYVTVASATTTGTSDTNCDASQLMGQSFEVLADCTLDNLIIDMKTNGTPSGSFQFEIYAHSGTYGTSSVPTGAVLATSDTVSVSSLTASYATYTTYFSGANAISLTAGQRYVLVCNYATTSWPNALLFKNKTPSFYGGNQSYKSGGTWTALSGYDVVFDLQGLRATSSPSNSSNFFMMF